MGGTGVSGGGIRPYFHYFHSSRLFDAIQLRRPEQRTMPHPHRGGRREQTSQKQPPCGL